MAGVNETPRQKMMGILYLVLLGLAATTITQQVLDSFRNLTVGLESSTNNVQSSIDQAFAAFAAGKLKDEPERAKPYWERANRVKAAAADLNKLINEIKGEFEKECGGFDADAGDYKNREDVDISPRVMITHKKGDVLKKKIEDTKAKILAEIDPKDRATFKMALTADAPTRKAGEVKKSWEENFGDGIPLTAAITALTKINADLKNTESAAIKTILGNVDKAQINFTDFQAVAVPTSSTYVLVGQPYTAEVYLTAFNAQSNPDIVVGGQKLNVAAGKGTYTTTGSKEGEFKWSATVHMRKADGSMGEWKTPELSYRVARPSAVVSAEMMNVFYVGVDNPVSVSAPGTPKEKMKVSIDNGTITGKDGKFNVQVAKSGKAIVSVFGVDDKGKNVKLGEMDFRCKRLPTPKAKFGGKTGGSVPKAQLTSNDKVFANLEDFDFKAQFNVTHFKLYIVKPRVDAQPFEATGNLLSAPMKAAMAGITPGTRVLFDDIIAMGPDGLKRPLDPIIFTVQ